MDSQPPVERPFVMQPIGESPSGLAPQAPKKRRKWLGWLLGGIGVLVLMVAAGLGWYSWQLSPRTAGAGTQTVEITAGMTPTAIGDYLEKQKVIRSSAAFFVYTKFHGVQGSLQAGVYDLTPSDSTGVIVQALVDGPKTNEIVVTFLPGATLAQHKKVLQEKGYSEQEVDEAFSATYSHPLLADKPASADLEGYIFGETHRFVRGTPVRDIVTRYFDDFYAVVQKDQLVDKYKAQGLSLYQGITLASIIQRESGGDDEAQIAQVFLRRLSLGMTLGSDVTYQYIADKLGIARDVNLDNPYNTRKHTGLPPGPIATPGVVALKAVGNPAPGDYLFFLSGDDNVTYFAKTDSEHEANVRAHCQKKCQIL